MNNKYIIIPSSIIVYLNGELHTIHETHEHFNEIKKLLESGSFDIKTLIDKSGVIREYCGNEITVEGGIVYFNDKPIHNNITDRIFKMYKKGDDASALINFLKKVANNPNPKIMDQIDRFLQGVYIPIGVDGCLYAYKAIRPNYTDIYSGKIDNSVGNIVKIDRKDVVDDNNIACGHGLHCGNLEYVKRYGGGKRGKNRLVVVRVDPENIVSVPKDHHFMKVRCCEYKVVSEVTWDYLLNLTVQDDLNGSEVISISPDEVQKVGKKSSKKTSKKASDSPSKWSSAEDKVLTTLRNKNATWTEIATKIGRSDNACRKRFKRLNK